MDESILDSLLGTALDFMECSLARSDKERLPGEEEGMLGEEGLKTLCSECRAPTPPDTGFKDDVIRFTGLGFCCFDSLIKSLKDGAFVL